MVSLLPLICSLSHFFFRFLETVPSVSTKIAITVTLLKFSRYLYIFSISFSFSQLFAGRVKSSTRKVLFFFFFSLLINIQVWPYSRDWGIRFYLNVSENFYASLSLWQLWACAYVIYQYGQTLVFCTISSRSN